jgi:hypothetical protein
MSCMKNVGHTPRTTTNTAKIIMANFMKDGASATFSCFVEPKKTWLRNLRAYARIKLWLLALALLG